MKSRTMFQISKEDLLMPVRSDSSCSLGKLSVDLSEFSERQRPGEDREDRGQAEARADTLWNTRTRSLPTCSKPVERS